MKLLVFSLVSVIVWSVYFSKEPHISEKSNSVALAEAATPTQELPDTKSENQSPRKIAAAMPLHAEANIDSEIEVEDEIDLRRADSETIVSQCQFGNWQACKRLHISCQQRNYDDCFLLGRKLSESSQKRAIPYYKIACEQNSHMESCLNLGLALLETEKPTDEILRYLHVACVDGAISMACLEMAENDPNLERRNLYKSYAQKLLVSVKELN